MSTLFDLITHPANAVLAYKKTLYGEARHKVRAITFTQDLSRNLIELTNSIKDGTYETEEYVKFTIYEPKERLIDAPNYRDKIVQHMLNNVIAPHLTRRFIKDSYACIVDKGNRRAVLTIQQYLRIMQKQYPDTYYVVKMDISKFFASIDREILKAILVKHIPCKQTRELLYLIIDGAPGNNGLPLGNLTSQVLANVYMNEIDHYIKRVLKVKYYVRYADDLFLFVESKEKATYLLNHIKEKIKDMLNLDLHPFKSSIVKPSQGLNALGFRIFPYFILLRYDSKVRIKRKIRAIPKQIMRGRTIQNIEQSLNSWRAFASTAKIHHFLLSLTRTFSYIYLDSKNRLRINVNNLFLPSCN